MKGKFLSYAIMAAAAVFALSSCTKEVIPLHLTVSTYEVGFGAEGGNEQINFCFVGSWAEANEECDWIETKIFISPDDASMKILSIDVKENTTGADREGEIVVSVFREGKKTGSIAERLDRAVKVRQSAEPSQPEGTSQSAE